MGQTDTCRSKNQHIINHNLTVFLLCAGLLFLNSCSLLHREVVQVAPATAPSRVCGKCHVEEYEEWEQSAHRNAYVSKAFKEQTDNYRDKECLACHAPNPIYGTEDVTARNHNLDEGVNCITCHLTPGQKIAGPLRVLPAHAVSMDEPFYRSRTICGSCHVEHLEQWEQAQKSMHQFYPEKTILSCQQCHMPPVRRKLITQGLFQYAHKRHNARKHNFTGTPLPKNKSWLYVEAEILSVIEEKRQVRITISHDIPHAFPGLFYGFKEIDVFVALKSSDNQLLSQHVITFSSEYEEYIPANKKLKYDVVFTGSNKMQTEFLEIKVVRHTQNTAADAGVVYFSKLAVYDPQSEFDVNSPFEIFLF